ncbi:chromosome segregation SMC family protein [Roseomonas sp. HF4]|uniref:chromosome segregation SMC family protein n=1 Tax=Roseomonas sp. HF4 TaxID=2562313 RepID=UPI001F101DE5|nr:AAA family ATPase [Roseomonas sp. HF4]
MTPDGHVTPTPEEGEEGDGAPRSEAQRDAAIRATLARIRIAGFKSFAEATVVEVRAGLTGIVGPNGCGKSNVVEALRWAMGETSAKAMRGGEMDDVIFAGTATRPGRNLAEVTLSLEEAEGLAPPPNHDQPELEIARRINRGEGSAFRVNGKEVRARDVQTMFADIGSGARASAMVSQGRVSTLIQAKPEDRRQVLEEAAGIAGLRARRHEAELKLRQAETNLSRAEDLLGQLDTQRQGLQRQARQANRYRNLSGLVRQAEGEWLAILAARAEAAAALAEAQLADARTRVRAAEAEAERAAIAAFEAEQAIPAPRATEAAARTALERRRVETEGLEAEERRAREALGAAEARLAQLQRDLTHAEGVLRDAEAARERLAQEAEALHAVEGSLPARRAAAEAALAAASDVAAAAERAAEAATVEAAEGAARAQAAAEARTLAEARLARARDGHVRLAAERDAADRARIPAEARAEAAAEVAATDAALDAARVALEQAEAARAGAADAHANARRGAAEAADAAARAEAARSAAEDRLARITAQHAAMLRDRDAALAEHIPPAERAAAAAALEAATEAVAAAGGALEQAEAMRAWAAAAHAEAARAATAAAGERARAGAEVAALTEVLSAREPGAAAPILDQVGVPAGLEAALGAALGEALESPAEEGGPRFWRSLPPLEAAAPLPGGAVPLSRLVEAPAALSRALSQIGLLPKEADGAALQAALRPGQSLVTEDGALWRWDGHTARAGAPTPGAVRLAQRNALRAAEAKLDRAEAEAATTEAGRLAAAAREEEARAAEAAARDARAAAEAALAEARQAEGALAARHARAESRLAAIAPQLDRLAADRAEAEAAKDTAWAAIGALPDLPALRRAAEEAAVAETRAQAAEHAGREARRTAEATARGARQHEAMLTARAAEAESRLAALEPQLARLGAECAEAEAALAAATAATAAAPDLDALRAAVDDARAALTEARAAEVAARGDIGALAAEAGRVAARLASVAEEAALWTTRGADAEARVIELRRRRAEAATEQEALAGAPEDAAARRSAGAALLAEAEATHAAAAAALSAAEARLREGAEARRRADAAFSAAREGQVRAEAAAEAAGTAGDAVAARIAERLGEDAELPPPPEELSDAAEEKAQRKVERLAREREEMGPVNLRAEIEVAEIEERITRITTDRDEVTAAIAKLRGSIGHLNREGRERLREVFDRVDSEFRGLFARLFGGGRAHLALVGSDDPLEAGLEIYAEPPGKKLATLSLLSGGEQALTALSLIFAVFRCHPAPVCVLDEVDAPLDDANVERLCDLLDAMAAESGTRFLVVTHHPLTMARMHRLYGVTMQERGVSRLLSVDLGQAVQMAEGPVAA